MQIPDHEVSAHYLPDHEGRTALHFAALNGYAETCKFLIEKGCELDCQDSMGCTALFRASSQGLLDVVQLCLEAGCAVDFADEHGNTALHEAAWQGFSKTVELLVKYNANVFRTNKTGFTALHLTAQNGHNESTRVLLYAGINPDLQNNYGDTALHTAARYGHAGVTRILISAKSNLNIQNKNGDTTLHIAAALKRRKIAKILVESHVDVSIRNKQNETAVDVARRKEHPDIILIITSMSRPHSTGPRIREAPGVVFKDEIENDDGPVVCADDEPPLKPEKQEKDRRFFPFFKKKKKDKDKEKEKQGQAPAMTVKKVVPTSQVHPITSKPVTGFFSQYLPRSGMQYYRDLAGNIKQGPIGYSPVCQCGPALHHLERSVHQTREELYEHIDATHQVLQDRIEQLDKRTAQQAHSLDHLTRERLDAERRALEDRLQRERHHMNYVVETYGEDMKGHIHDWIEDRLGSYGHCLDHHHDDTALPPRHIFSDIHLGPDGGRLFRSRSDETLSCSDYSGKGRKKQFYESRKAAMEQIRGWRVPSKVRDLPVKRQRGQSTDNLGKIENHMPGKVGNISGSSKNIARHVSSGTVTITTAEVHTRSHDRLPDGASQKFDVSPISAGGVHKGPHERPTGQSPYGASGVANGRQTPVPDQGAIPKRQSQLYPSHQKAQFHQTPSRLQNQSWQARSHGDIVQTSSSPTTAAATTQSSHPTTAAQPRRGILRSKTEDSGLHQHVRSVSTHHQPNLDERGPLDANERLRASSGQEGPLPRDAGSTGRAGSLFAQSSRHSNPLYGTTQSVLETAGNLSSSHQDKLDGDNKSYRPRTRSTDSVLEGDGASSSGRFRSRSAERVLEESGGTRPLHSPEVSRESSGYVTDSAVGKGYHDYPGSLMMGHNFGFYRVAGSDRKMGYQGRDIERPDSHEKNSVRPGSGERPAEYRVNSDSRAVSLERNSGYATDSGVKSNNLTAKSNSAISVFGQSSHVSYNPSSHRLPATRYRVLPPMASTSDLQNSQSTIGNAKENKAGGSIHGYSGNVNSQQVSSNWSTVKVSSETQDSSTYRQTNTPTAYQNYDPSFRQWDSSLNFQDRSPRQAESPRETRPGLGGQLAKDRQPYHSMHTLHNDLPRKTASSPYQLQPTKSESNLAAKDHKDQPAVASGQPQHFHASSGCLKHDNFSYSPVYKGDSKEDSTCSSNQDSGYSSRVLASQGAGYGSAGHSAESGTPSSSFSTDRSMSVSTPSNASSPFLHAAGNTYSDYQHMGGSPSDCQRQADNLSDFHRRVICHPGGSSLYSPADFQPQGSRNNPDYQRPQRPSTPSTQRSIANSGQSPNTSANMQKHIQGWYQQKLLEAAERLRNSEQYGQPETGYSFSTVPIHYDPVHGSDV
ncbi:hypothetical protein C0Q70_11137 [Pomacea canaliculata]|uniref:Uncharacterized protein n=1 Tax=Pomacea canaliculata TaxID=400727 RepID=A0A2T7P551_POMCA|nr:hypothetical protein C0Q70_11137 [Pomacea canaliculata]